MTRYEVDLYEELNRWAFVESVNLILKVITKDNRLYTYATISVCPSYEWVHSNDELMEFHGHCCRMSNDLLRGFYTDSRELPFIYFDEEERMINVDNIKEAWVENTVCHCATIDELRRKRTQPKELPASLCSCPNNNTNKGVVAAN